MKQHQNTPNHVVNPGGQECDPSDYEDLFAHNAIWLHTATRGLHDYGIDVVDEVVALIERHLPLNVLEWTFDQDGAWLFKWTNLELRLRCSCNGSAFGNLHGVNKGALTRPCPGLAPDH